MQNLDPLGGDSGSENMKKIRFSKTQLLWLYFYLWQIELSIDRAIHGSWKDMVQFLEARVQIDNVLAQLEENYLIKSVDEGQLYLPARRTLFGLCRRLFTKQFLFEGELQYIYDALRKYEQSMKNTDVPDNEVLVRLRMQLYDAKDILRKILGKRLIESYGYVAHYHYSEHLKVKELEELVEAGL